MPPMPSSTRNGPLRIGFVCPHNPYDRRAFSGSAFFAANALTRHPDITLHILGNHRPPGRLDPFLRRPPTRLDPESLDFRGLDALVGLVASSLIDRLERAPDLPFVHVTDATPNFLRTSYGWSIPAEADEQERRTVARATTCLYSSREVADQAEAEFGILAGAVPFGLNMAKRPPQLPKKPPLNRVELIFVSTDWVRKGGEIAIATLNLLRARGINAHLTVVGRLPAIYTRHPAVTATGYLNKNRRSHAARLSRLYARSHLMVLPTRADCTPMVMAEAMAHGTPVLASDVGGIGTVLGGAGAGRMLPLSARPADWAEAICQMTATPDLYHAYSDAARDRAESRLTWEVWADELLGNLRAATAWQPQGVPRLPVAV